MVNNGFRIRGIMDVVVPHIMSTSVFKLQYGEVGCVLEVVVVSTKAYRLSTVP